MYFYIYIHLHKGKIATLARLKASSAVMHLSMSSLGGGGGWATHRNLTVRSVPRVRILIICDVPAGVGNFDIVAILISGESGEGLEINSIGK